MAKAKAQLNRKAKTLSRTKPVVGISVTVTERVRFDTLLDYYEQDLRQVESKSEDVIKEIERLVELFLRLQFPRVIQTEQRVARANSLKLRFRGLLKNLHDEMGTISSNFDGSPTKKPLPSTNT